MKHKILFSILGLIAALIALAVIAPMFIPEDTYKAELIRQVEQATGRKLTIGGRMRLSLFPAAGVAMEDVRLESPEGSQDSKPFAAIKSLNVSVSLIPLLQRDIQVRALTLVEPVINLHVNTQGRANWQMTANAEDKPKAQAQGRKKKGDTNDQGKLLPGNVQLRDVKMTGGTITYQDDLRKSAWSVNNLHASIAMEGYAAPFTVDAGGQWNNEDIAFQGTLATLQSFFAGERVEVEGKVQSKLLSMEVKGGLLRGVYDGIAHVSSPSLKQMALWLSPKVKLPENLPKLALDVNGKLQLAIGSFNLTNAVLTLDQLQAKGNLKATVMSDIPQMDLDLSTGALDFNSLLGIPASGKQASLIISEALADASRWSAEPFDFSALGLVNITANIKAESIRYGDYHVGKTLLRARTQRGSLMADIVDADLYGGKGNVTLNITGGRPAVIETRGLLKDVLIEPLLKDAIQTEKLTGTADMQWNAVGRGANQREVIASLGGGGNLRMHDGTIRGISLGDMAKNITGAFSPGGQNDKTIVTSASATFSIAQGVISNKDLVMNLPNLRIQGEGSVNLPVYSISYRLTPQVVSGSDGAVKEGLAVPILVSGSLDAPSFKPDAAGALQNALQDPKKFREELKNSRGALKEQIGDPKAAVKNLKNMFKGM